jgi:hypothetical protein
LVFVRPHPLVGPDYFMGGLGVLLGLFYLWVAYGVFTLRRYILTPAYACAGFGLLGFPTGTLLSIFILTRLASLKHEFTK